MSGGDWDEFTQDYQKGKDREKRHRSLSEISEILLELHSDVVYRLNEKVNLQNRIAELQAELDELVVKYAHLQMLVPDD